MAITSKQRAQLKALAAAEDTIIQVGKGGVGESLIASVEAALRARELVKGRVLESCELTPREVCQALAEACGAEGVQVIGTKFVLYRRNEREPKITLVRDRKRP